ncbi:MAG TPA: hypothetical protein VIV55_06605 [Flavobacterium sp.]
MDVKKKKRHQKSKAVKSLENLAFEKLKERYPNFPYPIKENYTDATSNGLTKCVIDFITLKGFHAERINSTGAIKDKRTTSKDVLGNIRTIGNVEWIKSTTQNGTSDISATIQGRSVKIEIKCEATGDNIQSEVQKEYQRQIENAGGTYIIVRTFEEFYNWWHRKKATK